MKKPREPHNVRPIEGEPGRFWVESSSAPGEGYNVDISEQHVADDGTKYYGTCPCKGWSVRKRCTHLDDARQAHADLVDAAIVPLPSGRVYYASKVFLAGMNQEDFDVWLAALVERDSAGRIDFSRTKPSEELDMSRQG